MGKQGQWTEDEEKCSSEGRLVLKIRPNQPAPLMKHLGVIGRVLE